VREPVTVTPESSPAGTPSIETCVAVEASLLWGAGETVTRPPASEAETFSCAGKHPTGAVRGDAAPAGAGVHTSTIDAASEAAPASEINPASGRGTTERPASGFDSR
jgi:hypothetical protein